MDTKEYLNYSNTLSTTDSNSPSNRSAMNNHKEDIDEEKSFEVGTEDPRVSFRSEPHLIKRGMTEVSAMFDRNGKGYLDDTERALRRMDSQNEGFLGIDKVCVIFESLQNEQERSSELLEALRDESKKSLNLKKGVIALTVFTLLLALANVGTSFAIASLVKDMEVSNGELQGTSTGVRVGTTSKLVQFSMESLDETRRRRHLAQSALLCEQMTETTAGGSTSKDCQLQGVMKLTQANGLHDQLDSVDVVQLKCNGRRSEIFGGTHLQGLPGTFPMGDTEYMIFPDAANMGAKYQAKQNVRVKAQRADATLGTVAKPSSYCDANFELAMYCPTGRINGQEQDCLVMTAFQPTSNCPTAPVICGPLAQSPTFIN